MKAKRVLMIVVVMLISVGVAFSASASDKKTEEKASKTVVEKAGVEAPAVAGKVNINTASKDELQRLTKVGPKTADAIIAYRKLHGSFKTPEDITNVKGIGKKIFQLNKDLIVVE